MKKSFLQLVKMNEAPLRSFDVLPDASNLPGPNKDLQYSNSGFENTPKDLQTVVSEPFQKTLKTKMRDIPYPVYIYQMAVPAKNTYSGLVMRFQYDSLNPEFYHRVNRKALIELYGKEIANKIKLDRTGVTLVYNNTTAFPSTVWGFMHDFAHAITISESKVSTQFDMVEKIIERIPVQVFQETPDAAIWKKFDIEYSFYDLYQLAYSLLTMKSARTGFLRERPEEATTELMTQWLFSKKIEFDWSKISDSEEMDQLFYKEVNEAIPQIEQIFWDILMGAKGKAFFTS